MNKIVLIIVILPLLLLSKAFSQEEIHDTHGHNHDQEHIHDEHAKHHRYEFGIANSLVYFSSEKEFGYGLHLHFVYHVFEKMGIGLGYEKIFDEHRHNSLGIAFIYRPIHRLNLNFSPGMAFEGPKFEEPRLALHFETSYEFDFYGTHLGPTFEIAWDQEDIHFSLGIHFGLGF